MRRVKRQVTLCPVCGMWYPDGHCPLHNRAPESKAYRIPTRDEHNRFVRRIWAACMTASLLVFSTTGSILWILYKSDGDITRIDVVSSVVFQIVVLSYGMGFFVPAFITSLIRMGLAVEMSRQGLEIGLETARHIDKLQGQLRRMVGDAQSVVEPLRKIVADFGEGKASEVAAKVTGYIEKLEKDGTVEGLAKGIRDVRDKINEALEKGRRSAIDDEIDKI